MTPGPHLSRPHLSRDKFFREINVYWADIEISLNKIQLKKLVNWLKRMYIMDDDQYFFKVKLVTIPTPSIGSPYVYYF